MAFPSANGKNKNRSAGTASGGPACGHPACREQVTGAMANAAEAAEAACEEGVSLHRIATTACAAQILRCAGLDPEYILGLKPTVDRWDASHKDKSQDEEQT